MQIKPHYLALIVFMLLKFEKTSNHIEFAENLSVEFNKQYLEAMGHMLCIIKLKGM